MQLKSIIICLSLILSLNSFALAEKPTAIIGKPISTNGGLSGLPDFADIVEPLLPAVVNISTVHYPEKQSKNGPRKRMQEENSLDLFNEFLERFGIPPQQFDDSFTDRKIVSLGSGFIVDTKGYIVTNFHVIKDADEINIKMYDGTELIARVIGSDPRTDLALLKVEYSKDLPFVKFGNSADVRTGNWVIAIGNPYRLGSTVTAGIVSSPTREVDVSANGIVDEYIQTDAAINPGNSGGPLFNTKGEVIGVNRAIQTTSPNGGNIGLGFAIPASITEKVVAQLKEHGKVSRGMLCIRIQPISEEIAESLNMKTSNGALIVEVDKGEAGDKAGLQVGDIIIEYNGIPIKSSSKLPRLVAESPLGSKAKLTVLRNGKRIELEAEIRESKTKELVETKPKKEDRLNLKDGTISKHGILFGNITPEVQKEYGLGQGAVGIIVIKEDYSSSWMRKGLLKGDLITAVNQQPIKNVKEFEAAYNNAVKEKRKHMLLLVKRQDATLFIPVPLDETKE
ncbi:MAG: Periplasmic serine protease [Rickettsiaceae bacterium]|jgi:serine protease Do|nr:Periplasmic serine protease [Rickettsiaceae bacterium]